MKGAGGRGEALRFAAPRKGEQGVIKFSKQALQGLILKLLRSGDPAPAAGPPKIAQFWSPKKMTSKKAP